MNVICAYVTGKENAMKIIIQTPLKNEEIKALLQEQEHEGIRYTFIGKKGIGMEFECQGDKEPSAAAVAKQIIKSTDWGKVLYFTVVEE